MRSFETQPEEQTDHGVSNKVEFQVKTIETSKVTKVETINEITVPEVGDTQQLAQSQTHYIHEQTKKANQTIDTL